MVDRSVNKINGSSTSYFGVSIGGSNPGSKKSSLIGSHIAHKLKVILLGDASVGKTCLLHRFVENTPIKTYQSTIVFDTKFKIFILDQINIVDLEITDTCGEERFRALTKNYYRQGQGIILMFDLTDENSFNSLPQWLHDIQSNADKNIRIIIVGNKLDMQLNRKISRNIAEEFAENEKLEYIEISAWTGFNVDLLFEKISHQIIEIQKIQIEKEEKRNEQDIIMKKISVSKIAKQGKKGEGCC